MDSLVELLKNEYGLDDATAKAYAAKVMNGSDHDASTLKAEAFGNYVAPHISRMKRIAAYQDIEARFNRNEPVSDREMEWYAQVKEAEKKRIAAQAQAQMVAQRMAQMVRPAASAMADRFLPTPESNAQYDSLMAGVPSAQAADNFFLENRRPPQSPVDFFNVGFNTTRPRLDVGPAEVMPQLTIGRAQVTPSKK